MISKALLAKSIKKSICTITCFDLVLNVFNFSDVMPLYLLVAHITHALFKLLSFYIMTFLVYSRRSLDFSAPLYLCVTKRELGILSPMSVSVSVRFLPNFLKTFLQVLSLNFRARVKAQEMCRNIMIFLRLVRLQAKL